MHQSKTFSFSKSFALLSIVFLLSSCGGGSDSSVTSPPSDTQSAGQSEDGSDNDSFQGMEIESGQSDVNQSDINEITDADSSPDGESGSTTAGDGELPPTDQSDMVGADSGEPAENDIETANPDPSEENTVGQTPSIQITQLEALMQPETIGALVSLNKQGFLAVADTEDLTMSPDRRLFSGTLKGLTLIVSEGDSLPGISTRRRVDTFESLSVASDGSVSAIAITRGQSVESVVIVNDENGLRTLFRTGQKISTVNTRDLPIEKIFSAWRSAGRTLIHIETENANQVIILEDVSGFKVIAETADIPDLFTAANSPRSAEDGCPIDLNVSGYLEFKPLADDGSIILGANHDANCDRGYTILRYKDGVYSKIVANGDNTPGSAETLFSEIEIIELSANGAAVIQASVSRNDAVVQTGLPPHPFGHSVIKSLWQIDLNNAVRFMVAEGEELQGPDNTFYLTDSEVDFRNLNWTSAGHFALLVERANEEYLFEGDTADGSPYTSFDELGKANMRFVFSTLAVAEEPFPNTAFYNTITPVAVLADGRTLFVGEINNLAANTSIDELLQVSSGPNVTQTIYPIKGRTIEQLVENGDSFAKFTQLDSGPFVMHATTIFGQYFLTVPIP